MLVTLHQISVELKFFGLLYQFQNDQKIIPSIWILIFNWIRFMTYHNRVWISECAYHFDGSHSSPLAIAKIHRAHSNIFLSINIGLPGNTFITYRIYRSIHSTRMAWGENHWSDCKTIFDRNAIFDLVLVFLLHQKWAVAERQPLVW